MFPSIFFVSTRHENTFWGSSNFIFSQLPPKTSIVSHQEEKTEVQRGYLFRDPWPMTEQKHTWR